MALNPSNSSSLEELALKRLIKKLVNFYSNRIVDRTRLSFNRRITPECMYWVTPVWHFSFLWLWPLTLIRWPWYVDLIYVCQRCTCTNNVSRSRFSKVRARIKHTQTDRQADESERIITAAFARCKKMAESENTYFTFFSDFEKTWLFTFFLKWRIKKS